MAGEVELEPRSESNQNYLIITDENVKMRGNTAYQSIPIKQANLMADLGDANNANQTQFKPRQAARRQQVMQRSGGQITLNQQQCQSNTQLKGSS